MNQYMDELNDLPVIIVRLWGTIVRAMNEKGKKENKKLIGMTTLCRPRSSSKDFVP